MIMYGFRYDETGSKNHKVTHSRNQQEDWREPVYSDNVDVVATFQELLARMPTNYPVNTHCFCTPIQHPIAHWFKVKSNVSAGTLGKYIAKMCNNCGIHGDFTNNSCRATQISRMVAQGVPVDVIQSVTGHKNPKSLKRYDRTGIVRHISAQRAARGGFNENYQDHLNSEMEHWKVLATGGALPTGGGNENKLQEWNLEFDNLLNFGADAIHVIPECQSDEPVCEHTNDEDSVEHPNDLDHEHEQPSFDPISEPLHNVDRVPELPTDSHGIDERRNIERDEPDSSDDQIPTHEQISANEHQSVIMSEHNEAAEVSECLSRSELNRLAALRRRAVSAHNFHEPGPVPVSKHVVYRSTHDVLADSQKSSEKQLMYNQLKSRATGWDSEFIAEFLNSEANTVTDPVPNVDDAAVPLTLTEVPANGVSRPTEVGVLVSNSNSTVRAPISYLNPIVRAPGSNSIPIVFSGPVNYVLNIGTINVGSASEVPGILNSLALGGTNQLQGDASYTNLN
jgi:hypothetical protein